MFKPIPLSVTVELDTLTVTEPDEVLDAAIPLVKLFAATQFSIVNSVEAEFCDSALKPSTLPDAMLSRTVSLVPARANNPIMVFPSNRVLSTAPSAIPKADKR